MKSNSASPASLQHSWLRALFYPALLRCGDCVAGSYHSTTLHVIWTFEYSYRKNSTRERLMQKQFLWNTLSCFPCEEFGVPQHQPQTFSGSFRSAAEITASQPWRRDAVCLVIWWLIPCLFPTNLFPDKGVASTLVNMGDLAALMTVRLEERPARNHQFIFGANRKAPSLPFCALNLMVL